MRSETDYYDTEKFTEMKNIEELTMRVADDVFRHTHIRYSRPCSFLNKIPYSIPEYGRKHFRELDPTKKIGKREFKTVLPGLQFFS